MIATNETILRDLFAAYNRGDMDAAVEGFAEDGAVVDMALGATFTGPAQAKMWFATFANAFPGAQATVGDIYPSGDWLIAEHVGRGTHTGPLVTPMGTVPPTGRSIELHFAELFQFRDDKIVQMKAYYDSATLLRQIGVIS